MALRSSEGVAYVVHILQVLRRFASESEHPLFDALIERQADRLDTIGVDALLESTGAVGLRPRPTGRESGIRFQTRIDGADLEPGAPGAGKPCFVVRAETPVGEFAWLFADLEQRRWVRLRGRIGPMLVEQLYEAEGCPVLGWNLHALKERREDGWTDDVWNVNHYVASINALAFANDPSLFIETGGEPARRKGKRRKVDRTMERRDERWFLIRPNLWRIREIRVATLDDVESQVAALLGPPPVPPRG